MLQHSQSTQHCQPLPTSFPLAITMSSTPELKAHASIQDGRQQPEDIMAKHRRPLGGLYIMSPIPARTSLRQSCYNDHGVFPGRGQTPHSSHITVASQSTEAKSFSQTRRHRHRRNDVELENQPMSNRPQYPLVDRTAHRSFSWCYTQPAPSTPPSQYVISTNSMAARGPEGQHSVPLEYAQACEAELHKELEKAVSDHAAAAKSFRAQYAERMRRKIQSLKARHEEDLGSRDAEVEARITRAKGEDAAVIKGLDERLAQALEELENDRQEHEEALGAKDTEIGVLTIRVEQDCAAAALALQSLDAYHKEWLMNAHAQRRVAKTLKQTEDALRIVQIERDNAHEALERRSEEFQGLYRQLAATHEAAQTMLPTASRSPRACRPSGGDEERLVKRRRVDNVRGLRPDSDLTGGVKHEGMAFDIRELGEVRY
ncbi:hypothetical protein FIBSPDRAFT_1045749 [Athelia psychrophila]|uniref:Uncharacterized protein n=1 Tax=Athelia psychrophila TaxID=1759441 RepID=A0A166HTG6_9AGAM|nr:hypothetical protein FIBSPDRAFT_1045749 [Fibularhizoctonia sp. CBS 109695]